MVELATIMKNLKDATIRQIFKCVTLFVTWKEVQNQNPE
jgi:hypothetical protein